MHVTSLHVLGIQVHVHVILPLRDALCVLHIMLHAMFPCMIVPACWIAMLMNLSLHVAWHASLNSSCVCRTLAKLHAGAV